MKKLSIDDNWLPTAENVNALPERLRDYVQGLETLCDPSGMVRENTQLKDLNAGLQAMYRNASDARKPYTEWPMALLVEHVQQIGAEMKIRTSMNRAEPEASVF